MLRESIYNLSFTELRSFFIDLDEKAFRAEQLWNWLYVKGIDEFSGLNNISKTWFQPPLKFASNESLLIVISPHCKP